MKAGASTKKALRWQDVNAPDCCHQQAMVHGNCDYHSFTRFGKTFQMCDSVVVL